MCNVNCIDGFVLSVCACSGCLTHRCASNAFPRATKSVEVCVARAGPCFCTARCRGRFVLLMGVLKGPSASAVVSKALARAAKSVGVVWSVVGVAQDDAVVKPCKSNAPRFANCFLLLGCIARTDAEHVRPCLLAHPPPPRNAPWTMSGCWFQGLCSGGTLSRKCLPHGLLRQSRDL